MNPASLDALPDDPIVLKAIIRSQAERIAGLQHNCDLLAKWAFAPKSERRPRAPQDMVAHQGSLLFPEIIEAAERVANLTGATGTVEIAVPLPEADGGDGGTLPSSSKTNPKSKKKGRRSDFPEHLPTVKTVFELGTDQCSCEGCGERLQVIGEEVTKELERIETTVVHEIARKKYACRRCANGVKIAPGPDRVFDRGLLGVGFLASLITERFGNHMPYHRLEKKYESEGLSLSRSVLWTAAIRSAEILAPIAKRIRSEVLAKGVVQTDDTGVNRLPPNGGTSDRCQMWAYRAMDGQVFYDFVDANSRDGPEVMLSEYRGFLQADAHRRYERLYKTGDIVEVGCWAHARRRFIEAEKTEPDFAKQALDLIGVLYGIERQAKDRRLSDEARRDLRQQKAVPQLARLLDWLTATQPKVLARGPLGKAIRYALKKWSALVRYVEDGRLEIDNNGAERALRTVAVGRKNWTFVGNERAGKSAAVLYTLVMSAKAAGVDPRLYLRDLLLRVGRCSDIATLTPQGWKDRWYPEVDAHRQSILERMLARAP